MKITLETVRGILRKSLGRESFVASFVRFVEESQNCPTACISAEGVLQYNPAFEAQSPGYNKHMNYMGIS